MGAVEETHVKYIRYCTLLLNLKGLLGKQNAKIQLLKQIPACCSHSVYTVRGRYAKNALKLLQGRYIELHRWQAGLSVLCSLASNLQRDSPVASIFTPIDTDYHTER